MVDLNSMPVFSSLTEMALNEGYSRSSSQEFNLTHDYVFFKSIDNKKLLIFLPSALPKAKRFVPAFHRWSWMELFDSFDTLCVSDPTLRLNDKILGGWMQGEKENWALEVFLKHVDLLVKLNGYSDVVFSGSSLGGFVAIQSAVLYSEVNQNVNVKFYAENPQISLPKYSIKRHMDLLAATCYGVSELNQVSKKYSGRLDVVELIHGLERIPQGLIIVKESDEHHYKTQLNYFKSEIDYKNNICIEIIPKVIDPSGHTPLTICQMQERISGLCSD